MSTSTSQSTAIAQDSNIHCDLFVGYLLSQFEVQFFIKVSSSLKPD